MMAVYTSIQTGGMLSLTGGARSRLPQLIYSGNLFSELQAFRGAPCTYYKIYYKIQGLVPEVHVAIECV